MPRKIRSDLLKANLAAALSIALKPSCPGFTALGFKDKGLDSLAVFNRLDPDAQQACEERAFCKKVAALFCANILVVADRSKRLSRDEVERLAAALAAKLIQPGTTAQGLQLCALSTVLTCGAKPVDSARGALATAAVSFAGAAVRAVMDLPVKVAMLLPRGADLLHAVPKHFTYDALRSRLLTLTDMKVDCLHQTWERLRDLYQRQVTHDRPLINQMDEATKGTFDHDYWRPTGISPKALVRALELHASGTRRPYGIVLGHGTLPDKLDRAQFFRRILEEIRKIDALTLVTCCAWFSESVIITTEENKASVQLELKDLVPIPRDERELFCKVNGAFGMKWGTYERAFLEELRAASPQAASELRTPEMDPPVERARRMPVMRKVITKAKK
jgi:hypothetical protein